MKKEHFPLNLKKYKIEQEIPTPEQVANMEEPSMLGLIYKVAFYCLVVLLDIRWNTSHLKTVGKSQKKEFKQSNPVIKDSDRIKIK